MKKLYITAGLVGLTLNTAPALASLSNNELLALSNITPTGWRTIIDEIRGGGGDVTNIAAGVVALGTGGSGDVPLSVMEPIDGGAAAANPAAARTRITAQIDAIRAINDASVAAAATISAATTATAGLVAAIAPKVNPALTAAGVSNLSAISTEITARINAIRALNDASVAAATSVSAATTATQALTTTIAGKVDGGAATLTATNTALNTISTTLDNSLSSLPAGGTYAMIVTAAVSDGSGGVKIPISGDIPAGDYILPAAAFTGGTFIAEDATFTLSFGANNLVLINRSGAVIDSQLKALSYIRSMYPGTSRISTNILDKINGSGLRRMLGGTLTSVRAKTAAIDAKLLNTPVGVVATDLETARELLLTFPGATLQTDVQTLNSLLNGIATGSTVAVRIGAAITLVDGTILGALNTKLTDALNVLRAVYGPSPGSSIAVVGDRLTTRCGEILTKIQPVYTGADVNFTTIKDELNTLLPVLKGKFAYDAGNLSLAEYIALIPDGSIA